MDPRHLRTFVTAADCEHFTRAADKLGLTQAAVSKHIGLLEEGLGVALFERQGRAVRRTEAGNRLYQYAQQILALIETARHDVSGRHSTVHGTLKIATSSVPAEWLLPELLAGFHAAQPDVRVSVDVSDSAGAAAAVQSGAADLGIVGEMPLNNDLETRAVADDELLIIAAPDHAHADSGTISLERLRKEPIIVREPGSASRHCVEQHLQAAGITPNELNVAMEMNSNEAVRCAVQRGVGVAFQSRRAVENDVAQGRLAALAIRGVPIRRKLYLVTTNRGAASPAAKAFLDFLQEN